MSLFISFIYISEQVINIDADRVMKLAANRIPFSSVNVQQSIGQGTQSRMNPGVELIFLLY